MSIQHKCIYLIGVLFFLGFNELKSQDTIAARGIEEALEASSQGNFVSVTLARDTHSVFPERFFELPEDKVIALIVDNCAYRGFPDELARYQNIVYFRYSWFYFRDAPYNDFPPFLLQLKKLNDLTFERIKIPGVPKAIKKLKKLEYLQLYACKMPNFPLEVLKLKKLKTLRLPCNEFTAIPKDIDRLKALQVLSFEGGACGGTPIDQIPNSIGNLSNLALFELGYSKKGIKELPESFTKLQKLRRFECNGCGLGGLPASFGQLQALESISLMNIREFRPFPESFFSLNNVKSFRYYQYYSPDEQLLKQLPQLEAWGKDLKFYDFEISEVYKYPPRKK